MRNANDCGDSNHHLIRRAPMTINCLISKEIKKINKEKLKKIKTNLKKTKISKKSNLV